MPTAPTKRPRGDTDPATRRGRKTSSSSATSCLWPPRSKRRTAKKVPELTRAISLTTCAKDPVKEFVPVMERLHASGVVIGDVLADSGYAHPTVENFALPLRALGARLVLDLHPHDRGEKGTFAGAIAANGNLYCPKTPNTLLRISPLARDASSEKLAAHDRMTSELARYKLGRITTDDQDGYHRSCAPRP